MPTDRQLERLRKLSSERKGLSSRDKQEPPKTRVVISFGDEMAASQEGRISAKEKLMPPINSGTQNASGTGSSGNFPGRMIAIAGICILFFLVLGTFWSFRKPIGKWLAEEAKAEPEVSVSATPVATPSTVPTATPTATPTPPPPAEKFLELKEVDGVNKIDWAAGLPTENAKVQKTQVLIGKVGTLSKSVLANSSASEYRKSAETADSKWHDAFVGLTDNSQLTTNYVELSGKGKGQTAYLGSYTRVVGTVNGVPTVIFNKEKGLPLDAVLLCGSADTPEKWKELGATIPFAFGGSGDPTIGEIKLMAKLIAISDKEFDTKLKIIRKAKAFPTEPAWWKTFMHEVRVARSGNVG